MRRLSITLFLSTLTIFSAISSEPDAVVRRLSPGPGGSCPMLAIHPKNPEIILSGLDMGYAFRTDDGGKTWQVLGDHGKVNPGYRGCFAAAFSPSDPNVVWIASEHGAYKSVDCGKTFRFMTAPIGGTGGRWEGIVIDPADANRVYVFQGESSINLRPASWSRGRVIFTSDGGKNWSDLTPPAGNEKGIGFTDLIIDPTSDRNARHLMISGYSGLFSSSDGGKSWKNLSGNFAFPRGATPWFGTLDIAQTGKGTRVFATVKPERTPSGKIYGGNYISHDFGRSWKEFNGNLDMKTLVSRPTHKNGWMLRSCATRPERCYLGVRDPGQIYRSDDSGNSWKLVTYPGTVWKRINNPDGTWVVFNVNDGSGNYGHSVIWRVDSLMELAVSDSNPDVVSYNDNCGTTISTNGGKTWNDATFDYTEPFAPGLFGESKPVRHTHRIRSRGVYLMCTSCLRRDPFDPNVYYSGNFDHSLAVSRDGGKSWETPTKGLRTWAETGWGWCHSVTVDPQVKGRVYATFGTNRAYQSDDFGKSWKEIGPQKAVTQRAKVRCADSGIVIDHDSPENTRTLYLCSYDGVWKTSDGGKTWEKKSRGLPPGPVTTLVKIGKTLFAGSMLDADANRKKVTRHGLFRSDDGAESWHAVFPQEFSKRIFCVDYCRTSPQNIYVVTKEGTGYWGEGKIWRSSDGGRSWSLAASGKEYRFVAVNPYDPDWIYSHYTSADVTKDQPAWVRSTDGGKNWKTISGEAALTGRVYNLLIDPADPHRIYFHEPYAVCEYIDASAPTKK